LFGVDILTILNRGVAIPRFFPSQLDSSFATSERSPVRVSRNGDHLGLNLVDASSKSPTPRLDPVPATPPRTRQREPIPIDLGHGPKLRDNRFVTFGELQQKILDELIGRKYLP